MIHQDHDVLIALEEATAWGAQEVITHVAACTECRATLRQLESLSVLRATVTPDAEFVPRVAAAIKAAHVADAAPGRTRAATTPRSPDRMPIAVFVIASISAWLVLVIAVRAHPAGSMASLNVGRSLVLALAAGFGAAWHLSRIPRTSAF